MAKKSGRANDEYLRLYALEGFLLRLAASASSQDFVLKGGVLLAAYQLRRPTADIDFAALNPIPMVLAEKIVTASQRGITSTRWRDFADIYLLTGHHRLVVGDIQAAINNVSTYRNAEMGPLRPVLDGYPAIAQAKWHAWRTRQNLEDRLPADFHDVLDSVFVFTDGLFDSTRMTQTDIWSPGDRTWQ